MEHECPTCKKLWMCGVYKCAAPKKRECSYCRCMRTTHKGKNATAREKNLVKKFTRISERIKTKRSQSEQG